MKDRIGSEDGVLNYGGKSGRDDDSRQHCLVEVADQLFQSEGDGGDGRIESCRDAGRHADRGHAAAILGAQTRRTSQQAADTGTDLYRRAFQAERGAGADLKCTKNKLGDRFPQRNETRPKAEGDLDLGNTGAGGGWSPVGESESHNQAANARSEDGEDDPPVAGGMVGAIDEQRLEPADGEMKCDRCQSAESAGKDGDGEQALALVGHAPGKPGQ